MAPRIEIDRAVPAHAGLDEARHDALVSIAASGEDADRTERIALETVRLYLERARAASGAPISMRRPPVYLG